MTAILGAQAATGCGRTSGRACPLCPGISDMDLFRYRQGIIYFDSKISNRAFDLEGAVDPLDVDATILDRLERVGDLQQPACCGVGVNELARLDEFRGHGLRARIFKFLVLSSKRPRRHVARRPGAVPITTYPRARALGCSKDSLPRCPDVVSFGHRPLPEED